MVFERLAVLQTSLPKTQHMIDEHNSIVHPVVLRAGLPLFARPAQLKLLEARSFPAGAVLLRYGH
jgi:hypothetical protein